MILCNDRFYLWHKQLLMDMLSFHASKEKADKLKTKVKAWFPDGDLEVSISHITEYG